MWACEPGRTEALVRMFRENFLTLGSVLTLGVLVTHQSCNSFVLPLSQTPFHRSVNQYRKCLRRHVVSTVQMIAVPVHTIQNSEQLLKITEVVVDRKQQKTDAI